VQLLLTMYRRRDPGIQLLWPHQARDDNMRDLRVACAPDRQGNLTSGSERLADTGGAWVGVVTTTANAYRSWVSERKASATGGRRRCPTNTVLAKRLPPVGCTLWASLSMCPPPRCEPNRRNQQKTKNNWRVKGQCKRAVGSTNLESR